MTNIIINGVERNLTEDELKNRPPTVSLVDAKFKTRFWFLKIIMSSVAMGIFFEYLTYIFSNQLVYDYHFKSFYLILTVLLGLVFYLLISLIINAFNYKDLKLNY